jgi:hypothetical protein
MIHPANDQRLWWLSAAGPSDCDCPDPLRKNERIGPWTVIRCRECGREIERRRPVDAVVRAALLWLAICCALLAALCMSFGGPTACVVFALFGFAIAGSTFALGGGDR